MKQKRWWRWLLPRVSRHRLDPRSSIDLLGIGSFADGGPLGDGGRIAGSWRGGCAAAMGEVGACPTAVSATSCLRSGRLETATCPSILSSARHDGK